MKKNFSVIICGIVMLVTFVLPAFSNGGQEAEESSGDIKIAIVTDTGGLGDQAYNDAGYAGLKRVANDFDVEIKAVESSAVSEYESNLQTVAILGYDVVFALGAGLSDAIESVAVRYPDTIFVAIDGQIEGYDNVLSIGYREEQAAFLAGVLAAKMTKTGKIGIVLGMKIPVLERFEVGYFSGAYYADKAVESYSVYTGKFNDPGLGKETAITMYGEGMDIIAAAAGACNLGVFDAAGEKGPGYWAMGAAAGQAHLAPDDIIADQVKRIDNTIYFISKTYIEEGKLEAGSRMVLGLEEGGVDLKYGQSPADISDDIKNYIEDIKQKIISNEITVPTTYDELDTFKSEMD